MKRHTRLLIAGAAGLLLAACGGGSGGDSGAGGGNGGDLNSAAKLETAEDGARMSGALLSLGAKMGFVSDLAQDFSSSGGARAKIDTESCTFGNDEVTCDCDFSGTLRIEGGSNSGTVEFSQCDDTEFFGNGRILFSCSQFDSDTGDCIAFSASYGQSAALPLTFESQDDTGERQAFEISGSIQGEVSTVDGVEMAELTTDLLGRFEDSDTTVRFEQDNYVITLVDDPGSSVLEVTINGTFAVSADSAAAQCNSGRVTVTTLQTLAVNKNTDETVAGEIELANSDGQRLCVTFFNNDGTVTDCAGTTLGTVSDVQQFCEV